MDEYYYRVECINNETGESQGGYVCAIMLLVSFITGVVPDNKNKLMTVMTNSTDPRMKELLALYITLGDIPTPDVYRFNRADRVCLYSKYEFFEELDELVELSDMLEEATNGAYSLHFKMTCEVNDDDILYKDFYQIVIPRERYLEMTRYSESHEMAEGYDLIDEDDDEDSDDWDDEE